VLLRLGHEGQCEKREEFTSLR
jgi:hypothetical protein